MNPLQMNTLRLDLFHFLKETLATTCDKKLSRNEKRSTALIPYYNKNYVSGKARRLIVFHIDVSEKSWICIYEIFQQGRSNSVTVFLNCRLLLQWNLLFQQYTLYLSSCGSYTTASSAKCLYDLNFNLKKKVPLILVRRIEQKEKEKHFQYNVVLSFHWHCRRPWSWVAYQLDRREWVEPLNATISGIVKVDKSWL